MSARAMLLLVATLRLASAQEFSAVPPAADDALRFSRPLPDLEIKDVSGRVWRAPDFRGKYTLVYLWHTFEARTVDAHHGRGHDQLMSEIGFPDLRQVQRFYDAAKAGGKLQVLTFCSDYDYTHAPEYLRQAGFTFPVVADWKLIDEFLGPQTRGSVRYAVIGPDGKLSAPFRSWTLGRVLFELEAVARR